MEKLKIYLKDKINNSWYKNAKEDYGIDGHFIDCESIDKDTLKIIWEENGIEKDKIINYYWDYNFYQIYCIWMEM
ncbi:MAG: hypothetical protein HFH45_03590 [Bacilli bacterium]|nr:hypothetical protein [Bacilli bacterium]